MGSTPTLSLISAVFELPLPDRDFLALIQTEGQHARFALALFHDQRDIAQQISALQRDFLTVDLKHKHGFCGETEAIELSDYERAQSLRNLHTRISRYLCPDHEDGTPFTHTATVKPTQIGARCHFHHSRPAVRS